MQKKSKKKSEIILSFPFVPEEQQEHVVSFLESNGYEIIKLRARASYGDMDITCTRPTSPICLCCLGPLQESELKESNQMCKYCSSGDCEVEVSKLKFEKGHGNIQHALHISEEEEDKEDTPDEDDIEIDKDEEDDMDEEEEDEEDEEDEE